MVLDLKRRQELLDLVDVDKGLVDRSIFPDEEISRLELEQIFARAWNFVCHESQIPNPGDFFLNFIGEDRVIVVRDNDGAVQVLLNTCRHRGNAVCRAQEGHATSFMCTYHGWTYDLQGKLIGLPGYKEFYHEDIKREEWGLIKAAQVDNYLGFIFATLDPTAPSLDEYLGDVGRMGLSHLGARGDMAVVEGVQRFRIGCNWKLAVDNVWDYYHGQISHASAMVFRAAGGGGNRRPSGSSPNLAILGEYGHAIGGPAYSGDGPSATGTNDWRESTAAKELLGPVGLQIGGHPNIFPNMWLTGNQVSLRVPKGPGVTEIWWFTLLDRNLPPEVWEKERMKATHTFGPAGLLEQEDGENWAQSTVGTRGTVSKRYPLNYSMNRGRGEVIEDELGPPRIETPHVTEHAQLWHYRSWAEWMTAESWDDLKLNHSPSPSGRV